MPIFTGSPTLSVNSTPGNLDISWINVANQDGNYETKNSSITVYYTSTGITTVHTLDTENASGIRLNASIGTDLRTIGRHNILTSVADTVYVIYNQYRTAETTARSDSLSINVLPAMESPVISRVDSYPTKAIVTIDSPTSPGVGEHEITHVAITLTDRTTYASTVEVVLLENLPYTFTSLIGNKNYGLSAEFITLGGSVSTKTADVHFDSTLQPIVLIAEAPQNGLVKLLWSNLITYEGTISHQIYKKVASEDDSTYTLLATQNSVGYTDTDVVNGTVYAYKVRTGIDDGSDIVGDFTAYSNVVKSLSYVPMEIAMHITPVKLGTLVTWEVTNTPTFSSALFKMEKQDANGNVVYNIEGIDILSSNTIPNVNNGTIAVFAHQIVSQEQSECFSEPLDATHLSEVTPSNQNAEQRGALTTFNVYSMGDGTVDLVVSVVDYPATYNIRDADTFELINPSIMGGWSGGPNLVKKTLTFTDNTRHNLTVTVMNDNTGIEGPPAVPAPGISFNWVTLSMDDLTFTPSFNSLQITALHTPIDLPGLFQWRRYEDEDDMSSVESNTQTPNTVFTEMTNRLYVKVFTNFTGIDLTGVVGDNGAALDIRTIEEFTAVRPTGVPDQYNTGLLPIRVLHVNSACDVTNGDDSSSSLIWGAVNGAASYKVFTDEDGSKLVASDITTTSTTIAAVNGAIVNASIVAVGANGKTSFPSHPAAFVAYKQQTISNLTSVTTATGVVLNWDFDYVASGLHNNDDNVTFNVTVTGSNATSFVVLAADGVAQTAAVSITLGHSSSVDVQVIETPPSSISDITGITPVIGNTLTLSSLHATVAPTISSVILSNNIFLISINLGNVSGVGTFSKLDLFILDVDVSTAVLHSVPIPDSVIAAPNVPAVIQFTAPFSILDDTPTLGIVTTSHGAGFKPINFSV